MRLHLMLPTNRSVIKRPTDSTKSTTSGQTSTTSGKTSTMSGKTSTTSGKTSTSSGKTSTTSGKTSTTSEKANTKSTTRIQANTTSHQTSFCKYYEWLGEFCEKSNPVIIPCLRVESKITIYFLKMSFRKSLFAITVLAYSAETFVTFTFIFSKVCEDIHK